MSFSVSPGKYDTDLWSHGSGVDAGTTGTTGTWTSPYRQNQGTKGLLYPR
jgi:hypothetical protein